MDREETYLKLPLKNNEPDWLPFDQNWLSGLEMANCHPLIRKLFSLYGQGEEMHEVEWKGWRLFVCPDYCAVSCNFLMDIEEDADLIIDHGGLRITIQGLQAHSPIMSIWCVCTTHGFMMTGVNCSV